MMHTRAIKPKSGPPLLVRPLRNRDVETVLALFARLGDESRRLRFNGPKPRLGVADGYHQRGIGSALTRELITDARVAGVTEVTALVSSDNPAALALLRRTLHALEIRLDGPEYWIRAKLGPSFP